MRNVAVFALGLCLAACGSEPAASEQSAAATGQATGETQLALGLTERQLLDADLVDASGNELGDVEGLVRDSAGAVQQLLIEIEDTSPDRYVHVPLDGLEVVTNGDDRDLRTSMTRDQLMVLPEARR